MKFYLFKHCGNVVEMIRDAGVVPVCCGEKMVELRANTVDASFEKHIPAVTVSGDEVAIKIGEVEHPMIPEHYIEWVVLETENGSYRHSFKPGDAPAVTFHLAGEKAIAAYAYCNIHGLWKKEL